MKIPKCYIAGKISDLEEQVYKANFKAAKSQVIAMCYIPVSPIELPHNHGKNWEEFMKEDIIAMLQCDAVFALDNYHQSKGAVIEVTLAQLLGIKIIHQL
jgi:hypothetical protein